MATSLPPFPANSMPGSWAWTDWWKKLQDYIKEVTTVAKQKTLPAAPVIGVTGITSLDVPWVVVANYCQIDITILPSGTVSSTNGYIELGGLSDVPPAPIDDGLLNIAAWSGVTLPSVQSIGVGYIRRVGGVTRMYLPNFSSTGYERIHITGRYNIS